MMFRADTQTDGVVWGTDCARRCSEAEPDVATVQQKDDGMEKLTSNDSKLEQASVMLNETDPRRCSTDLEIEELSVWAPPDKMQF